MTKDVGIRPTWRLYLEREKRGKALDAASKWDENDKSTWSYHYMNKQTFMLHRKYYDQSIGGWADEVVPDPEPEKEGLLL